MYPIPWYVALFVSVPQTLIIILLGFNLFNLKIDERRSVMVALIMGVICYGIRLLHITLALNTVFVITSITILAWAICKTRFIDSLLAILLGAILCGVIENLILQLFFMTSNYTISDVLTAPLLDILLFIPILLIMVCLYYMSKKFNIIVYDLDTKGGSGEY